MSTVINVNCIEGMAAMPDASVDAIVCDPPYELGFMGKKWDASGIAYSPDVWGQALRVLKPGGHLLAFGGTRTHHRMMVAIEDAGFEIRDVLMWLYGSGFPKSLDVSKAIDAAQGVMPSGYRVNPAERPGNGSGATTSTGWAKPSRPPKPIATGSAARQWEGWGTALKPAYEPIVLARKPLIGTVAANVLAHGTGAINVDACRIGTDERMSYSTSKVTGATAFGTGTSEQNAAGRWPANILLDEDAAAMLDAEAGASVSRFFYVAKASKSEREAGLDGRGEAERKDSESREPDAAGSNNPRLRTSARRNDHPTVKPIALMRWLVRLVTPPGGVVLDPFAGSGTTLVAATIEGFESIGMELDAHYCDIAEARVKHWGEQ